jgi:hypothetical protein
MPERKLLDLVFPTGGINKVVSYSNQRPYTTPDCQNVRPTCVIKNRERGGTRQGLGKFTGTQFGSGNPIRLLTEFTAVKSDGLTYDSDYFDGSTLGSDWTTASWIGTPPAIYDELSGASSTSGEVGAVYKTLTNLDTSKEYVVEIYIEPYMGVHCGTYYLFSRMNNSTPDASTDGCTAVFTMNDAVGTYSGYLNTKYSGIATNYNFTGGTDGVSMPGLLQMFISANNVTVKWRGTTILNSQAIGAHAGKYRVGFGMNCTVAGGISLVGMFRAQYYTTSFLSETRDILCVSSNGSFYTDTFMGTFAAVTSSCTLSSAKNLQAVGRYQKLYIADHDEPRTEQTNGTTDAAGTALDSASVSDWTTLGILAADDVVVITSGTNVTAGTYAISTVSAGTITLSTSAGANGSSINFGIYRAPKIYNPATGTLTKWTATAGKGSVPSGSEIICLYRDRMVLAKDHIWYMSKSGDPLDWNYGAAATDTTRAVSGQSSDAGILGQPIKALIPHMDDYLIVGCENSLWVIRGDPVYGGQQDTVSSTIGIVDKDSWCKGPQSEIIFLSKYGVYVLSPGYQQSPIALSPEILPDDLINIDPKMFQISMSFDFDTNGVNINLTSKTSGNIYHWYIDWSEKSFWKDSYPRVQQPMRVLQYSGRDKKDACVMFGCIDGYLRYHDNSFDTDDGTSISSYVYYGPIKFGKDNFSLGMVAELTATLAKLSGSIKWKAITANSNEDLLRDPTTLLSGTSNLISGTWANVLISGVSGGKTYYSGAAKRNYPRRSGCSMIIRLSNNDNRAWAIENMTAVVERRGKKRIA